MIGFNFYGLFISLAILAAFWLTAWRARRRGLDSDLVWESLPWILAGGIIGARLYHVLNFLLFYLQNPILIPQVWLGGLGLFGGIFGGLFGFLVKLKIQKLKIKITVQNLKTEGSGDYITLRSVIYSYLDCAALGIPLAQAIGRLGNIINGELMPYAVWELVADLSILVLLLLVESFFSNNVKLKIINFQFSIFNQFSITKFLSFNRRGGLFLLYLFCYSMIRFLLEFFRTDSPWIFGPLTVAQWVSLAVLVAVHQGTSNLPKRRI